MSKEAKARIKINKLLEEAGWRFFDDCEGKANIILENNTKITQQFLDEFGEDFEKTTNGFIDYLLLDDKGFPFIVLEAKKEGVHPLTAKEQTRKYAQSQNCRFIILSNGISITYGTCKQAIQTSLPSFLRPMKVLVTIPTSQTRKA